MPSLIVAGYKDYAGYGKQNNQNNNSNTSSKGTKASSTTMYSSKTKEISDRAIDLGKKYGISVGRLPGSTKISGRLQERCKATGNSVTLGNDKGNVGLSNGKANQNIFGEVEFECQKNSQKTKSGKLILKGEGGNNQRKKGGYSRIKMQG